MMRKDFQEVERSKIKKSKKMMRKDFQESIGIFFCDRRLSSLAHLGPFSYFSYDGKMMRKDVSGG
jgi:hypothetical protein